MACATVDRIGVAFTSTPGSTRSRRARRRECHLSRCVQRRATHQSAVWELLHWSSAVSLPRIHRHLRHRLHHHLCHHPPRRRPHRRPPWSPPPSPSTSLRPLCAIELHPTLRPRSDFRFFCVNFLSKFRASPGKFRKTFAQFRTSHTWPATPLRDCRIARHMCTQVHPSPSPHSPLIPTTRPSGDSGTSPRETS